MRSGLAILAVAAIVGAGPAFAEKRMFIIGNSPDDYGIDRCLAGGAACGSVAAMAYCRARAFSRASSFRKIDREEISGGVSSRAPGGCVGATCADFVAIECTR
jgi:hypothetical protein